MPAPRSAAARSTSAAAAASMTATPTDLYTVSCSASVRPGRVPLSTSPSSVSRSGVETAKVVRSRRERREHRLARLDEDCRVGDERLLELGARGIDSDGGDVRARRQPLAADDRLRRVRRRAHDVGAADGLLERVGRAPADFRGKRLGLRAIAAGDADLLELAHSRDRPHVRARLHAGAADREHLRVVAREHARRERGARRGSRRRDVCPVHERRERAALRVEHGDRSLVRRQLRAGVPFEQRHELRLEEVRRR